jgi:hypothetical protein
VFVVCGGRVEVFSMVVNCAKTRLMVIAGLGRYAQENPSPVHVTFRDQPLEVVEQIRYLGVMFFSSLGFGGYLSPPPRPYVVVLGNTPLVIWSPPRGGFHWIALSVALRLCCTRRLVRV